MHDEIVTQAELNNRLTKEGDDLPGAQMENLQLGRGEPALEFGASPNLIAADSQSISPPMLTLIELDQQQIDVIVQAIPGGASSVQDIYPLSPLQDGMLFHHLLHEGKDTYILSTLFELESKAHVAVLMNALQRVITRHDILRSSVHWENLPRSVQVVHRRTKLPVEELLLDKEREAVEQLKERMKPGSVKLDLRQAPLVRMQIAADPDSSKWYAVLHVHHLACDHQSLRVAVAEVMAFVDGREHELPPPVAFRAHVAHALAEIEALDSRSFFRGKLADVDEPTAPFGLMDVQGDGRQIMEAREELQPGLAGRIRVQARRCGVSTARFFHSAWSLVAAHTSGRDDVVFGTVLLATRQRRMQAQRMLGLSVNTLPLRLQLRDISAIDLLQRTHQELVELLSHEVAPLTVAQRCSGIAGMAPLFTSLLNFRHSARDSEDDVDGTRGVRVLARGEAWTNYPLTLTVDDLTDGFVVMAKTDPRVDPRRIIGYFRTALESLVKALEESPQTPALQLSVLPECERHEVIDLFNSTQTDYPSESLVHELFEQQAKRVPDSIAVKYEAQSVTYAELNAKANQLARHLSDKGVGPDRLVALFLDRSVTLLVGLLAILKAGGAYIPLDPSNPAERLEHLLRDAAPTVLLTRAGLLKILPRTSAQVISIDEDWSEIAKRSDQNIDPGSLQLNSRHLAYVIYTSGSTGKPKGVMVEHRNLVNYAVYAERRFDVASGDGTLICTSFSFDLMLTGLYPALVAGRTVRLCKDQHGFPALAEEVLQSVQLAPLKLTPSHLALLEQPLRNGQLRNRVRVLVLGGEPIQASAVQLWRTYAPETRIFNHYGPTEATIGCVVHELESQTTGAIPIGRPIANAKIYILDKQRRAVPIGVSGDIYVGGVGVARGYLNRPELTRERFIPDPFSAYPEARMYMTGDLGRWRIDGAIEYLGRSDHQVKIRGFRVELGEIESRLITHGQVKEAVVHVREDVEGEKRLVAYVTRRHASSPTTESLRAYLAAVLPEYMVPSAFVIMEQLPLTPNGKLDRRALPLPNSDARVSRQYEVPQGEVEELLAGIWQSLLRVERVGRHDNFFELGGHSLLIVRMMERMRQGGLSVSVKTIYGNPTLAGLVQKLTDEKVDEITVPPNLIPADCNEITPKMLTLVELSAHQLQGIVEAVPGGAANIQDIYPLAPLQEGILFHHLFNERTGDPYIVSGLISLSSKQALDRFIQALESVIERHDTLRTIVLSKNLPQPLQVVCRRAKLPVRELSPHPGSDPIEWLRELMRPEHQRWNLRQAPLMRLQVVADPHSECWYVLMQSHHLICDHESRETVLGEVMTLLRGNAEELAEPYPYRHYVAQVLAHTKTHDVDAFFHGKLLGVDEPTAPFGLLDVHGDGGKTEQISQVLELELARSIRARARQLGVSAATLFHTAWALVLSHTSGRNDVVFGTVLLGWLKGSAGARRAVGMFMNTLPLRVRLDDMTVMRLVEQTQRELVELLGYEHASLAAAQRCSGLAGSVPLFSSLLNYRHTTTDLMSRFPGDAEVRTLEVKSWTNYPVVMSVDDIGEGFVLVADTDRRIDPRRVLGYMQTAIRSLLQALEEAPDTLAMALVILPVDERRQVIETFNSTDAECPLHMSIQELFETHVRRTPNAIAVTDDDRRLTYAQLNRKANQLAHHLQKEGVRIGEYIPILMPRSSRMLIGQLAVLKSGGVYVPIDPSSPAERQAFMIEDCHAQRVLSNHERISGLGRESLQWMDYSNLEGVIEEFPDENPVRTTNAVLPAYVMYTSGSTGIPKGVVVTHRAVNRLVINNGYARIEPTDCVAHCSNPAFDASTFEIWGALLNGATLLIVPQSVLLEPKRFAEELRLQRVSVLWLTTGLFTQYAEALATVIEKLRYLITGGDTVDPSVLRRVLENGAPGCLLNAYGPTECTTFSTTYPVNSVDDATTNIPIGRPIANSRVYILGAHLQPVPVGVSGEIYIGGMGVGLGYLNRSELTAERFVADPFSGSVAQRLYRSGDLGRWRADGAIEFLGRNDQQVKLRSFRVELGEVEATLARHPCVKEAVVSVRRDVQGEKHLVAYVVRRDGDAKPDELRMYLEASLPEYMIPAAFVVLENLPLTSNGKVNRRALPAPALGAYAHQYYESPKGRVEETLAEIWQKILPLQRVGRNDNFFELGGHSLLVLKALFRINESFECTLSVRDVYGSPTLRDLAARIDGAVIQDDFVDLAVEATLDDNIVPIPEQRCVPAKAIMVTGSTGFVGRFLLAQILEDTDAMVYCLVRSPSQHQAASRLRVTLQKWDLWRDEYESRIVAIPGDLRLPCLGVAEATYKFLCRSIDVIYHCATSMNHLETYAMAKAANVKAAIELLRMATSDKQKLINYASTLSVFSASTTDVTRVVDERSAIDHERHLTANGYAASKWVAERIFMNATERGIPCNIFRLGLIWADTQLGRYDDLQREHRIFKSCLLSGYGIEDYRYDMAPTPVDYVARAVVFLGNRHHEGKGIFHISSSAQAIEGVFERCNEFAGTALKLLPYYDWLQNIKRLHLEGQSLPVVPLVEFAFSMSQESLQERRRNSHAARILFESARTRSELEKAGIASPIVIDEFLRIFVERLFSNDAELQELIECNDNVTSACRETGLRING